MHPEEEGEEGHGMTGLAVVIEPIAPSHLEDGLCYKAWTKSTDQANAGRLDDYERDQASIL